MNKFFFILIIAATLISSCRLGPKYASPEVSVPESWKGEAATAGSLPPCVDCWWEIFEDAQLNSLEEQAIQNSPNIEVALQKVVEAWAQATVNGASLYPQLTLNPSYTSVGQLFKLFLPPGFTLPTPTTLPSVYRIHQLQYLLPLNMSYELDLWGRLRGQYDSAVYLAESQEEDFRSVLLTLTSNVASTYYNLRSLDAQLIALDQNIALLHDSLRLADSRRQKGLVTNLDVNNAQVLLSNAIATYEDAQRNRTLLEDSLAVLIGLPAPDFHLDPNPLFGSPPAVPTSLPSEILLQRPDIASLERAAASEHALIGPAYASFFPSISLTGTLGYLSPDLKNFLRGKSRYWSLGASGGQTIFDGGRNCGNLEAAWAYFRQASASYQQQVLIAFQEVEDSLNNLEKQTKEYLNFSQAAESAKKNTKLSLNRYSKGLVNYLEVINNEQNEINADLNRINMLGQRYISTVQLIKAMGGSWGRSCDDTNDAIAFKPES